MNQAKNVKQMSIRTTGVLVMWFTDYIFIIVHHSHPNFPTSFVVLPELQMM